ncbi:Utp11 protein, partial [Rhizoctonia solani AG-3 Rhs1AP]
MGKMLRTQDEGYLRTVKKEPKCTDATKTQLTAMVDLVPTAEDIDDLVDTLRSAAVLSSEKSSTRKGKGKAAQATPWHIVFVDKGDQGVWASEGEDDLEGWSDHDMEETEGEEDQHAPERAQKSEAKRQKHRLALLHELSARLQRDSVLRHTLRELELQKHLMAPGAHSKIRGPERVERDEEDDDGGNKKKRGEVKVARQGEVDYTPRVYKWRSERKR